MKIRRWAVSFLSLGIMYAGESAPGRLQEASEVLREIMATPDKGIPQDLLEKANCIVIVPGLKKGAFIVGGKYGRGFVSCRRAHGWSAPAGIKVEGGSVGFQIGGSETDAIMLVMNERGGQKLMSSKFTLGADASIAGGPVGRTAAAQTDAKMTAEILTYSRARGVFAGVALDGATLRPDEDANGELYGNKKLSSKDIINGEMKVPAAAAPLINRLNQLSRFEHK